MQQKMRASWWRMIAGLLLATAGLTILGCAPDRNDKISEIYALRAEASDENVTEIRALLEDPDRDVRATALNALVGMRVPDAAELARAALDDEDGFVRATAAKLVGDLESSADVERLASMLTGDSDPIVRQRAAEALMRIGGETAVAGLARGLDDPLENVRLAATRGIRELDPDAAKPALARLLLEDPHYEIRVQAARALGTTGDPEMRPLLEAALEDPNEFVRAAAANALRTHESLRRPGGAGSEAPGS